MNTNTSQKQSPILLIIVAVVALVAGLLLWKFVLKSEVAMPAEVERIYIPNGRPVVGLDLVDGDGMPFTEQRLKDKWSFLFFGFTNCPDVCPTTMLVLKSVWNRLPEAAKQSPEPQMIFVSVDPDRDKPELLKAYTEFYHPDFVGITGKHDKLDILTVQVGALYGYEDGDKEGEYTVNHSGQIVLIDPQGHFRGVFSTPHLVDEIVKGFSALRDYHSRVNQK